MTDPLSALALLLAALAAWALVGPRVRRAEAVQPDTGPVRHRSSRLILTVAGAVLLVPISWLIAGGTVGVLVGVAVTLAGTAAVVTRGRLRERRLLRSRVGVARAAELLAGELTLGKVPAVALAAAAEDAPVLRRAAAAAGVGAEVPAVWLEQASEPGNGDLLGLAQAWQVATRTGAPLGPSLARVASALREDEDVRRTAAGELAAPRMTGVVLALLPLAGIALGYLIGGDPLAFLFGSLWGQLCLLTGTVLAGAGLIWTERLGAIKDG
ncbi:type II secretion system protein [Naumannella sp. ID2617S]|nr:type II secretion system F family protein [Enemella dayhoffiae]NNG20910.1 type II secretion system protein [Naumannella sp. ID2617S]